MNARRRLAIACALALSPGLVALPEARLLGVATVEPGTVQCTDLTGQVRFHPPLAATGSAPEVASMKLTLAGCTIGGGNVTPSAGHGSVAISMTSNACTTLTTKSVGAMSVAIRWSPSRAGTTSIRFPGLVHMKTGTTGLQLGGPGTTASGSYTGADGGASSTATVLWSLSATQIAAACAAKKGLGVMRIQGGNVNLR